MGKRSPLWEYFYDTKDKHHNNKTHNLAICLACLDHIKSNLENDETRQLVSHSLLHRSSEDELKRQGMYFIFIFICSTIAELVILY